MDMRLWYAEVSFVPSLQAPHQRGPSPSPRMVGHSCTTPNPALLRHSRTPATSGSSQSTRAWGVRESLVAHSDAGHASWSQHTSCVPFTSTYCWLLMNWHWSVLSRYSPHLPDRIPLALMAYYKRVIQAVSHRSVILYFDQYCII